MKNKSEQKKSIVESTTSSSTDTNKDNAIWKDPRFSHLVNDPRFKTIYQSTKKVKIDKRFQSMFNDKHFKVKYKVDKYGRKVTNQSSKENLKKFYQLNSDDNSEDEDDERKLEEEQMQKEAQSSNVERDVADSDEDDEELTDKMKTKLKDLSIDYARGEGNILSCDSSSDDEDDTDDEDGDGKDDEIFIEHVWGELDADAPTTDESTKRLAACNLDWDRIRAEDIMILCNSFLPPGGTIISVTIYPSEYGKERLAEEEVKGPQELISDNNKQPNLKSKINNNDEEDEHVTAKNVNMNDIDSDDDSESDNSVYSKENEEEGDSYHMEKLRQYQLNRLKYYYAVIECDSVKTADKLYKECDGLEYESTATKLDFRFVPDDMTFDDEPKDFCTELPDLTKYTPRLFTTTALQQAKVELTWDETNLDRKEINDKLMAGKFDDVADTELRKYVAYSSEDDDEDGKDSDDDHVKHNELNPMHTSDDKAVKDPISKYKALLNDINRKEEEKKNKQIEMEYTWGIGIQNRTNELKEKRDVLDKKIDKNLSEFEKILEKQKEKKKLRKIEKKKLRKKYSNKFGDDNEEDTTDANSDDSDDLPDGINLNDPYFAEEFANGKFEEKPKKSKKNKKISNNDKIEDGSEEKSKELALLVDDTNDEKTHFSLKKIQENENETKTKKKRKRLLKRSKKQIASNLVAEPSKEFEDDFQINLKDTRFDAVYSSHLFNIDPSDPHYKKTKSMELIINEKLKRKSSTLERNNSTGIPESDEQPQKKHRKMNTSVNMLVKSIKRKVAQNL